MTLPDFASLSIGEVAGLLLPLAALVFVSGIGRALATATVLWTYAADWITSWMLPALVLVAVCAVGQGVPPYVPPNVAISVVFGLAAVAYFAAAVAAVARNLGVDMSRLPFSRNVAVAFDHDEVAKPDPKG